jgi:hypothetical protein
VTDRELRLILDTSAVVAYARGSIDVGETITEVVNEDQWFGASVVCMAEAFRLAGDDRQGVGLLAAHRRFVALPADASDWPALAAWTVLLGRVDLATSMLEAVDREGWVLTGEPRSYELGPDDGELPVIPIG